MNQTEEIWKPVVGYEGLYEVSNLGRIKSLPKIVIVNNGGKRIQIEKLMRPINAGNGYYRVQLSNKGKQEIIGLHRIVATAFIPNPNDYPVVNHKDENPANNNANNLEWCTYKYNSNYGTRNEKISEKNLGKKLTITRSSRKFRYIVAVSIADKTIIHFNSLKSAEKYGFLHSNVSNCCNNRFNGSNTYKGFRWFYKEDFDALAHEEQEHQII